MLLEIWTLKVILMRYQTNEVVFGQQRKGNPYDKVVKVLSSCEPVKPAK